MQSAKNGRWEEKAKVIIERLGHSDRMRDVGGVASELSYGGSSFVEVIRTIQKEVIIVVIIVIISVIIVVIIIVMVDWGDYS